MFFPFTELIVNFESPGKREIMVQDAANRLITALQKQTDKIIYFCSVENVSPNLAIHEMRKSFKRLRALLWFYIEFPEEFPPEYKNRIKEFGHSISTARESFVNIHIFEKISAGNNLIPDQIIRTTKEKLAEKNRILVEDNFLSKTGCLSIKDFINDFELQLVKIEIDRPSHLQLLHQLINSYEKAYNCFLQTANNSNGEVLHDLRIKLKRLWYQFDFIKFIHPRYFKVKSDQLNKITEQLGEDHDLYVLALEVEQNDYGFNSQELEIIKNQIQHTRELNLLKLQPRLKQFFNEPLEVFVEKMNEFFKIS